MSPILAWGTDKTGACRTTSTRTRSTSGKGAERQGGAAAPDPAAYGLSPPLFQPLTAYAAPQDLPCTSAGNAAPGGGSGNDRALFGA